MAKQQFKLYLDESTIENLKRTADELGERSPQVIVEKVLRLYLETWRQSQLQISQTPDAQNISNIESVEQILVDAVELSELTEYLEKQKADERKRKTS